MSALAQIVVEDHNLVRSARPSDSRSAELAAVAMTRQERRQDVVKDSGRIQLWDDSRIRGIVFEDENNNQEFSEAVELGRQRWNEELLVEFAD